MAKQKDFAPGLPDPSRFGDPSRLPTWQLLPWVVQEHNARRAGKHKDVRFGRDRLYSFATKKELPEPGGRIALYQQPFHRPEYAGFEGRLPPGYGEGTVKKVDQGEIVVTRISPGKVVFVKAHTKNPERFVLIKNKVNPKTWLLVNITPTKLVNENKVRYLRLPAEQVEKVMDDNFVLQPKVDGAAAFFRIMNDKLETVSYRTSSKGKPIVHTERMAYPQEKLPKEFEDTLLRGELYGERKGKAIPASELGGVLNATLGKSLRKQRETGAKLKGMLFDVRKFKGKQIPPETPYSERRKMLEEILPYLPKDQFGLPPEAKTEQEKRKLFEKIRSGEYPLTTEGVVAHPIAGGKPTKIKFTEDADVIIRNIFPGMGKYEDSAGGFEYSLKPRGPIVGKVGTGFTDADRLNMMLEPENWVNRIAKIQAQQQFPSGAYRAPGFIARHEG